MNGLLLRKENVSQKLESVFGRPILERVPLLLERFFFLKKRAITFLERVLHRFCFWIFFIGWALCRLRDQQERVFLYACARFFTTKKNILSILKSLFSKKQQNKSFTISFLQLQYTLSYF
jgi:hypothetical protein